MFSYYKVILLHCVSGLLCQLDDACISNPCQKGSNCDTNPVFGNHFCTCPSGYRGVSCDQDVDECSLGKVAKPCLVSNLFDRELLNNHTNIYIYFIPATEPDHFSWYYGYYGNL